MDFIPGCKEGCGFACLIKQLFVIDIFINHMNILYKYLIHIIVAYLYVMYKNATNIA